MEGTLKCVLVYVDVNKNLFAMENQSQIIKHDYVTSIEHLENNDSDLAESTLVPRVNRQHESLDEDSVDNIVNSILDNELDCIRSKRYIIVAIVGRKVGKKGLVT